MIQQRPVREEPRVVAEQLANASDKEREISVAVNSTNPVNVSSYITRFKEDVSERTKVAMRLIAVKLWENSQELMQSSSGKMFIQLCNERCSTFKMLEDLI